MVKYIANIEEFNNYVEMSKEKLVVIDFTADWYVFCDAYFRVDGSDMRPATNRIFSNETWINIHAISGNFDFDEVPV